MSQKMLEKIADYMPNILFALLLYGIGYIVIKFASKLMRTALGRTKLEETGGKFLISVIQTALYVILCVMILSQLKVPMSSIVTALGTAGLAIGLALQNSLSNVAGGFIVMFNGPFKVGDFVEIAGKEGYVESINILSTRLLTTDNKVVIIPNSTVTASTITNYTAEDMRRLEMHFNVSYEQDFRIAQNIILQTVKNDPLALDSPELPYIRLYAYSQNSLDILLRVWVKSDDYMELRFGLLAKIKEAFDREGISIPYDQLDIHISESEKI